MCKEQVHQFSGARFKKFSTRSAAQQYIADCNKVVPKTQNGDSMLVYSVGISSVVVSMLVQQFSGFLQWSTEKRRASPSCTNVLSL